MASYLYDSFKNGMLDSTGPDLSNETTIKAVLVNSTTYADLAATHDFFNDVVIYVGVTAQLMTTTTITAGVFDAANVLTFTAVDLDGANDVDGIVIFSDTGTPATSPLIAMIDGFTAVTPNGGDITITWDSGANKIFALT